MTMAKRKPEREQNHPPAAPGAPAGSDFALHEHIGRQLRGIFDEVVTQPVPDKFRKLLDELERKQGPKQK
jgi:anti-sigma factor NepR-like protein